MGSRMRVQKSEDVPTGPGLDAGEQYTPAHRGVVEKGPVLGAIETGDGTHMQGCCMAKA